MVVFRRKKNSQKWHFCTNCSDWPADDYMVSYGQVDPMDHETCRECYSNQLSGNCEYYLESPKIDNLKNAKEFFQHYDCSHFHMDREDERYSDYKKLGISKEQEDAWKMEVIHEAWEGIQSGELTTDESVSNLLKIIRYIEDRLISKSKEALDIAFEATGLLLKRVRGRNLLDVARAQIGNNRLEYRPGMVFLCYDLGQRELARESLQIAIDVSQQAVEQNLKDDRRFGPAWCYRRALLIKRMLFEKGRIRRKKRSKVWHFCTNCSKWPTEDYIVKYGRAKLKPLEIWCYECCDKDTGCGCEYEPEEV